MRRIVTLTTDFQEGSPYVAAMKGVILSICPDVTLVDVTHAIPPQNVLQGARVLKEVVPLFPEETIHVAVVDPGVGSERELLAVQWGTQYLVLPDNGLLTYLAERDVPQRYIVLENPRWWRAEISTTFHGRDILAPVAAYLAAGKVTLEGLGREKFSITKWAVPLPQVESGRLVGEIAAVDSFGNLQSNITWEIWQKNVGNRPFRLLFPGGEIETLAKTYSEMAPGKTVALFGSEGWLEVAVVCGNAARRWNLGVGAKIEVLFPLSRQETK
ncbi:MAG: SAM-dependent chlorinase/fluorinase [Planctomycetia bacterium]|nr:SAM-dependent chlorinase/fluorinase [Planctomycetia bacterium]